MPNSILHLALTCQIFHIFIIEYQSHFSKIILIIEYIWFVYILGWSKKTDYFFLHVLYRKSKIYVAKVTLNFQENLKKILKNKKCTEFKIAKGKRPKDDLFLALWRGIKKSITLLKRSLLNKKIILLHF